MIVRAATVERAVGALDALLAQGAALCSVCFVARALLTCAAPVVRPACDIACANAATNRYEWTQLLFASRAATKSATMCTHRTRRASHCVLECEYDAPVVYGSCTNSKRRITSTTTRVNRRCVRAANASPSARRLCVYSNTPTDGRCRQRTNSILSTKRRAARGRAAAPDIDSLVALCHIPVHEPEWPVFVFKYARLSRV
eukprot:IDg1810t1